MSVRFSCEKCGKFLKAVNEKIGLKVICSDCGQSNKVPESDDISVAAIGVRQREKTNLEQQQKNVDSTTQEMLQEVIYTYHTTDAASGTQERPKIAVRDTLQRYVMPLAVAALFGLALWAAFNYSSSRFTD